MRDTRGVRGVDGGDVEASEPSGVDGGESSHTNSSRISTQSSELEVGE